MSDKFDRLDATEKAATEAALNRCRALAHQIEGKLRNGAHPVENVSLAFLLSALPKSSNRRADGRFPSPGSEGQLGAQEWRRESTQFSFREEPPRLPVFAFVTTGRHLPTESGRGQKSCGRGK
jgi:hypothetical protein